MRSRQEYRYKSERREARFISALIDIVFLLLIIFGLPDFLQSKPPVQPQAIVMELLPITGITNVKPSEPQEAKAEKPQPKQEEQKKASAAPPKPADPAPSEPAPVDKTKDKIKKPERKPEPKKPDPDPKKEAKKKPVEDDFKNLLNDLKNKAEKQKKEAADKASDTPATPSSKAVSTNYNPSLPMSLSELDAIQSQIAKCYSVPAGAKDIENMKPVLRLQLGQDGSLIDVKIAESIQSRYAGDGFFRAATDAAVRAVKQCTPIKGLPPEKYETWREMLMEFNIKEMLQ